MLSRRQFLISGGVAAGAAALGVGAVGLDQRLDVAHLDVPAPTPGLKGLRVGFASDVHRSSLVSRAEVEGVAAALDAEDLDLLVIGGDLASVRFSSKEMIDEALEILGGIRARLGRVVIQGNHDVALAGSRALRNAGRLGFTALVNEGLRLEHGGSTLYIAGIDDHHNGHPDVARAFREHAGEPVLFLTHNPDALIERMEGAPPVWLALAGHLHGGQVRLPLVGAPYNPSRYPHLFDWGWVGEGVAMRAYVSRGTGVVMVPIRIYCPPEICIFTLV
jgi:predicted MPP superfamily phosphohydrolase